MTQKPSSPSPQNNSTRRDSKWIRWFKPVTRSLKAITQKSRLIVQRRKSDDDTNHDDRLTIHTLTHTPHSLKQEIRFLAAFYGVLILCFILLFGLLHSIAAGIILGCVAAYIIDPIVEFLSHTLKWPRFTVVISSIFMIGMILAVGIVVGAPLVVGQAKDIITFFPVATTNISTTINQWIPIVNDYLSQIGIPAVNSLDFFKDFISFERITAFFQGTFSKLLSTVPGLISFGVSLAMMPLVMYLYLQHFATTRQFMARLIPEPHQKATQQISMRLSRVLKAVIMGQIYVAAVLGLAYAIGYVLIDVQGAVTIGIASGIGKLIPYADMIIALLLSATVILSTDPAPLTALVGSGMVIIVVSILDTVIVTPKLMGSSIGVHPILVVGSVIGFSTLMGVWGMILAIPIMALLKECVLIALEYYQKWRSFYTESHLNP